MGAKRPVKMPYGMGSISGPDKTGKWQVRISLGFDESGKRRRKIVRANSSAEARAALDKLRLTYGAGDPKEEASELVAAYFASWIARKKSEGLESRTIRAYESGIKNLTPYIGHQRLKELTSRNISEALSSMQENGKGTRTVQVAYDTLRASLNFAIQRDKCLTSNPLLAVPRPRSHREIDYLRLPEVHQFLDAVQTDTYRALWHLVVSTGMRWGEISALRWSDVDLDAAALTISRAMKEDRGFGKPKTKGSVRRIDLAESVVIELREHKEKQRPKGCTLVFAGRTGEPLHASNLYRRHFYPALKAAKLRRIRFHDLRHTAASLLLGAGEPIMSVAAILGHTQESTTLNVYGHLMPGATRAAASTMNAMLKRRKS